MKSLSEKRDINFYYPNHNTVSITLNETTNIDDLNSIINLFREIKKLPPCQIRTIPQDIMISVKNQRKNGFLKDIVFNKYHSETKLMRYIKYLENKDLALNRSMISLGSCTMKLNAAAEMLPLSWNRWGNIHPLYPKSS